MYKYFFLSYFLPNQIKKEKNQIKREKNTFLSFHFLSNQTNKKHPIFY